MKITSAANTISRLFFVHKNKADRCFVLRSWTDL